RSYQRSDARDNVCGPSTCLRSARLYPILRFRYTYGYLTARRTGTRVKTPRPRVGLIRSNLAAGLSRTVTFFETVDRLHRSEDLHAENLIGLTNVELATLVLISSRSLRLVKRNLLALY